MLNYSFSPRESKRHDFFQACKKKEGRKKMIVLWNRNNLSQYNLSPNYPPLRYTMNTKQRIKQALHAHMADCIPMTIKDRSFTFWLHMTPLWLHINKLRCGHTFRMPSSSISLRGALVCVERRKSRVLHHCQNVICLFIYLDISFHCLGMENSSYLSSAAQL